MTNPIIAKLKAIKKEIESDERFHYEAADVSVNAPLALIQMGLKGKYSVVKTLLDMIGELPKLLSESLSEDEGNDSNLNFKHAVDDYVVRYNFVIGGRDLTILYHVGWDTVLKIYDQDGYDITDLQPAHTATIRIIKEFYSRRAEFDNMI